MSASMWLSKKKKGELQTLAKELGIDTQNKLKSDLEQDITDHLAHNQVELVNHPSFSSYYETLSLTPAKPSTVVRRRQSRHYSKTESPDEESPNPGSPSPKPTKAARTPRTVQRVASRVPLPMSPGDLANAIDNTTTTAMNRIRETTNNLIHQSGTLERIAYTKDFLSKVDSISALTVAFEFILLMRELIPVDFYQLIIPAPGKDISFLLKIPNVFVFLSWSVFWQPLLFWGFNALAIPLTVAYFVNLKGNSQYDPLSFSVARGLTTYFVYTKQILNYSKIGLFSEDTGPLVSSIIGDEIALIGSAVSGIAAIWYAVTHKTT